MIRTTAKVINWRRAMTPIVDNATYKTSRIIIFTVAQRFSKKILTHNTNGYKGSC
jgi:hypothetical protein